MSKNPHTTLVYALTLAILSVFMTLCFNSCDGLFGPVTPKQTQITITDSGLTENKYIRGKIQGMDADITLDAKSATCIATVVTDTRAVTSYSGYFVYNKNEKSVSICFPTSKTYITASADLSGTRGSVQGTPVEVTFTDITEQKFLTEVSTVASLSGNSSSGNSGDSGSGNSGDSDSGNTPVKPSDVNTGDVEVNVPYSRTKTVSDYEDGTRELNLVSVDNNMDTIFVSTIQPRQRPDYSAIDNAVRNLDIPTTETIENAAKLIVETSGATTIKEKARAFYTWIAANVDYDYSYKGTSSEAEGTFTTRMGVCGGYSHLMYEMCKAVGIKSDVCVGLVTWGTGRNKLNPNEHAWNLIYLDNSMQNGFVMDVTYGSNGSRDTQKTVDYIWFDPDPCYFATSHWANKEACLISCDISRDEFMKLPELSPSLERYGIDGKELLEFCFAHNISMPAQFILATEVSVLKMPVGPVNIKKTYEYAYEYNDKLYDGTIYPDRSGKDSVNYLAHLGAGGYMKYVLDDSIEEEIPDYNSPNWIVYDDTAEFIHGNGDAGLDIDDTWSAVIPTIGSIDNIRFRDKENKSYCAVYDAVYQEWNFVYGHYVSNSFWGYRSQAKKEFDVDLATVLDKLIVKLDPSIPRNRTGNFADVDFNTVYVPLSKEQEFKNSVINYDWVSDEDFSDFVYWMQDHNVPNEQIEFYKAMAKYPYQRGKVMLEGDPYRRYVGPDEYGYPYMMKLESGDPDHPMNVGGMQLFFEYRKQEKRHLFNNDKVSILLVKILDSDKDSHSSAYDQYIADEIVDIKKRLDNAGFRCEFEVETVEISLSYSDLNSELPPQESHRLEGYGWGNRNLIFGTEKVLAALKEKDVTLWEKYKDNTKTSMIKLFVDDMMMNLDFGWQNDGTFMSDLFRILHTIGYGRNHVDIFGSVRASDSPSCYGLNCIHDEAICPLCMYSYNID